MTSKEFRRYLAKLGATFTPAPGESSHVRVELNGKVSIIPMHGSRKELGTGLVQKIKKDLGLR